jgi:5'-nucleotidase
MKILLVNDDGITSIGLYTLAQTLRDVAEIYIVAPITQQSGASNAMTMHRPLTYIKQYIEGTEAFAVDGTPADCLKMAMHVIFKNIIFDFVFSGINHGHNAGINAIYSGTISGATEASIIGKKALAISLDEPAINISDAAIFVKNYIPILSNLNIPRGTILNMNIPDIPLSQIKGYKYTKQGTIGYADDYHERTSPRGLKYYWQSSQVKHQDINLCDDYRAITEGFVSITPISIDRTNYELLKELSGDNC